MDRVKAIESFILQGEDVLLEIIVHKECIGIDRGVEEALYYINNPVELEFILKSIGVIE